MLRLDSGLHGALRAAARAQGVSLNEYCARKLAAPLGDLQAFEGASEAIRRAAALLGESLVAVVVFGSWARGDVTATSDVDLLIVAGDDVPLTRDLYRRWDETPLDWGQHVVEPHFVRTPATGQSPSGFWAEIAVDGIVLYQRDAHISNWLAVVRRQLAEGRLQRRTVQGQAYWTRED